MCFVLPSDLNQLDQQVRPHQHLAVDSLPAGWPACSTPRCLRYFARLRTAFKWIYRSRQPSSAPHLMQPTDGQPTTGRPSAPRLPPSFPTSFCLNKIYLLSNLLPGFENLLLPLLLYSLVYHQVRPILTSAVFYSRLSALAFGHSFSGELAADLASDASTASSTLASLDGPPSDVQFLLPFISLLLSSTFLRSFSLRDLLLSTTLLPLDRFSRIHFAAPRVSDASCQKRNLRHLAERLFGSRNGSSYKLPNFRLFLNEFASKSSSALGVINSVSIIHSSPTITSDTTISKAASVFSGPREQRPSKTPFRSYLAILVVLLNAAAPSQGAVRKATLYTAGFFPLSGEKADLGLGILPAVQLALDDITENDVIPGYKLDLVGNDTMVSRHLVFLSAVRLPMARQWLALVRFLLFYYPLPILLHNSEPFK